MQPSCQKRKLCAVFAVGQGLLTAVAPGLSVKFLERMLEPNFENVDALDPRPGYLRQLRALGIGLAAAGIAGYVMEAVAEDGAETGDEEE